MAPKGDFAGRYTEWRTAVPSVVQILSSRRRCDSAVAQGAQQWLPGGLERSQQELGRSRAITLSAEVHAKADGAQPQPLPGHKAFQQASIHSPRTLHAKDALLTACQTEPMGAVMRALARCEAPELMT